MKPRKVTHLPTLYETALKCLVCQVAMCDEKGNPYVIPMNFGLQDGIIYLHSAPVGKKITILRHRPQVCVNFSTDYELRNQNPQVACSYSMKYRSVMVYGRVEFIEDLDEKVKALNIIMQHYTGKEFSYNLPALNNVLVWRVIPEIWEGRFYGY